MDKSNFSPAFQSNYQTLNTFMPVDKEISFNQVISCCEHPNNPDIKLQVKEFIIANVIQFFFEQKSDIETYDSFAEKTKKIRKYADPVMLVPAAAKPQQKPIKPASHNEETITQVLECNFEKKESYFNEKSYPPQLSLLSTEAACLGYMAQIFHSKEYLGIGDNQIPVDPKILKIIKNDTFFGQLLNDFNIFVQEPKSKISDKSKTKETQENLTPPFYQTHRFMATVGFISVATVMFLLAKLLNSALVKLFPYHFQNRYASIWWRKL